MVSSSDEKKLKEIRKQIFVTGYNGGGAHLASSFSAVEILYTLYCKGVLKYSADDPNSKERDRFILSKGHAGLALYVILAEAGFFSKDILNGYQKPDGLIGGEPNKGDVPGIEVSTGSLGHGLSMAIGMALAQKVDSKDSRTYVLLGDGEIQEGSVWEAAMSASAYKLNNLVAILDNNCIQKTGAVKEIVGFDDWKDRWESFGWCVLEADGHNIDDLKKKLTYRESGDRPILVVAHTTKGKGVSIMEGNPVWHYKLPNKKELQVFLNELDIDENEVKRG
ncbi:MAG: transketolase [Lachnospiraceae bacterium]|nr:transketolase [Lachnospiraceae bacterium]